MAYGLRSPRMENNQSFISPFPRLLLAWMICNCGATFTRGMWSTTNAINRNAINMPLHALPGADADNSSVSTHKTSYVQDVLKSAFCDSPGYQVAYTPKCSDYHNVNEILAQGNISDAKLLRLLRYELLFCTNKDQCQVSGYLTSIGDTCCSYDFGCSCTDDCVGNCCPGAAKSFKSLYRANQGTGCYKTQLFLEHMFSFGFTIIMVDKCKNKTKANRILHNCENKRTGFESNVYVHIPAYAKSTTTAIYKNRYCALCNDISEKEIVYWKMDIQCSISIKVKTNIQGIFDFVQRNSEVCNIMFVNPSKGGNNNQIACAKAQVENCKDIPGMDPFYKEACGVYTSLYKPQIPQQKTFGGIFFDHTGAKQANNAIYKNIFCYLCNGFELQESPNTCETLDKMNPEMIVPAFTALIDFNRLVPRKQIIQPTKKSNTTSCREDEKWDFNKKTCWKIFCSDEELVYTNHTCESIMEVASGRSFTAKFKLLTDSDPPFPQNDSFTNTLVIGLSDEIWTILKEKKISYFICRFFMAYVFQQQPDKHQDNHVEYILVGIDLHVYIKHRFSSLVQRVMSMMNNRINVTVFNNLYAFEMRLMNDTSNAQGFNQSTTHKVPFQKNIHMQQIYEKIRYCSNLPYKLFEISAYNLCPKILFPVSMFRNTTDNGDICLIDKQMCWSEGGFLLTDEGVLVCSQDYFSHLDKEPIQPSQPVNYSKVSSTLSMILTSVSVLCLLVTAITYMLHPSLRTTPGKNILALTFTLMTAQVLYQFGINRTELFLACQILGVLIHFTWLSSICWMTVCTFHMFRTFVMATARLNTNNNGPRMIYYIIFSVVLPALFISTNVITRIIQSDSKDFGYGPHICYISNPNMIAWTFALPVALMLLSNLFFFAVVIYKIQRVPQIKSVTHGSRQNLFIFIKLSCITGLFWIIGFVYQWTKVEVFGFLFIILNASQGIFIMLAFVCNVRVLKLYRCLRDKNLAVSSNQQSTRTTFSSVTTAA